MNDERPDLGRAPTWAKHLHDCMHDVKTQQQSDRQAAADRDRDLQRTLDKIVGLLGKEGEDGKSGTGFIGEVRRQGAAVSDLTAERNMVRGALAAFAMVGALFLANFKLWVQSVVGTSG